MLRYQQKILYAHKPLHELLVRQSMWHTLDSKASNFYISAIKIVKFVKNLIHSKNGLRVAYHAILTRILNKFFLEAETKKSKKDKKKQKNV